MALALCILGKFLGVGCHCFPPPSDVPTFIARCLHVPKYQVLKKIFVGNGKSYMEHTKKSQVIIQPFVFMLKNWHKLECTHLPQEVCFKQKVINFTLLTLRLLMSYIYGAPILDVSRSHTTQHSR